MRETGEDEGPPLRLSKKPSARVCRPQAAKKSNRFSRGVYVVKRRTAALLALSRPLAGPREKLFARSERRIVRHGRTTEAQSEAGRPWAAGPVVRHQPNDRPSQKRCEASFLTHKGPGAEAPGPSPAQRYVRYSRLFSSALLNRCMTLPPKVMLILAP